MPETTRIPHAPSRPTFLALVRDKAGDLRELVYDINSSDLVLDLARKVGEVRGLWVADPHSSNGSGWRCVG